MSSRDSRERRGGGLPPPRLRAADVTRVGAAGLRARPLRVVLSALGIAIGIAAMVAVVGISTSSRAELDQVLDTLGTNLLTASPGQSMFGEDATLPEESVGMVARLDGVRAASATATLSDAAVYRTDRIPEVQTKGLAVLAARTDLPATVGAEVTDGVWLNRATARYPAVVLGSEAARLLGIRSAGPDVRVWLGGRWFTVIGILAPAPLAEELDTAAVVGWSAARRYLEFDGYPTMLYARADPDAVSRVRDLIGHAANPAHPEEVEVARPSDALAAKGAVDATFTSLLLGLGAVALLVGGVGVANTMVISVLERRGEIGLRRALGATRRHIRVQFLAESQLLSGLGGVAGVALGGAVTAGYALWQGWPAVVPAWVAAGGLAVTLLIGAVAGLYPALRAARLPPTDALATP